MAGREDHIGKVNESSTQGLKTTTKEGKRCANMNPYRKTRSSDDIRLDFKKKDFQRQKQKS
jgi:hypothetical protein